MKTVNADQFNKEIMGWANGHVTTVLRDVQRKFSLDGLTGVVNKTPVRTGCARGGWQVGINQQPQPLQTITRMVPGSMGAVFEQVARLDPQGASTIAAGQAVIEQLPAFSMCYIVNNVHYILTLEDGGSQQAPNGMLSVTVEELKQSFAA